ncbi:LysR family transcriptional regulator [Gallaecimonas pentaromativorans]|uniref:LysR family transcriptional regulator n=1 Tax=Gallaecimonas pentaromativorans TaxID=584787 RepID=UPI003A8E4419
MDRFQEMQVFVRIAQSGSFSKASEDLQIPRATVSNLIKRLEGRLGVRLLERTTRQVRLTQEGKGYYRRAMRILADLEEADTAFRGAPPKGLLRVNLQGTLAKFFVLPALGDFVARYPDITLQLGEDDRLVDLVREGIDCVLRAGPLRDSSLVAKPLAQMRQVTVASPAYLARFGTPRGLEDLAGHQAVAYIASTTGVDASLDFTVDGELNNINLDAVVSVNGADMYTGAALSGLGLIQVPRYRIERELQEGALVEVLAAFAPPAMPVSALYPQNRQLSPRVRVFVDWLAERFSQAQ